MFILASVCDFSSRFGQIGDVFSADFACHTLQMDSNEADLMNEKTFDPHQSKEEDSFQAATLAEPGSTWRAGLDCQMPTRTSVPEVGPRAGTVTAKHLNVGLILGRNTVRGVSSVFYHL